MQHFYGLQDVSLKDAWLTIGSFDGVHLGHQQIIQQLTAGAHALGSPAVVLTFYPHPSVVLRGPRQSFYLTTPEEKAELLGGLGVDAVITHPFNQDIQMISARDFVERLCNHLDFKQLWVGHDFALGHNREGDAEALRQYGKELGFEVKVIEAVKIGGQVISSSRVRELLEVGEVEQVEKLLGRPFAVRGAVVVGEKRGRTIGIPTANLDLLKERAVPGAGVYACHAVLDGKLYQAVTNVGVRPTFELEPVAPRVEAHILDFDRDIYGQELEVRFLARLRDEQRFSGVDALVAQIQADIEQARKLFSQKEVE